MTYECESGTPYKYWRKILLEPGTIVRRGQILRTEQPFSLPLTDDDVKQLCSMLSAELCKLEEVHLRYYHLTNTQFIGEFQILYDIIIVQRDTDLGIKFYLLQTIPDAITATLNTTILGIPIKAWIPIILGFTTLGIVAAKRKK
jgi:hypothetical protein